MTVMASELGAVPVQNLTIVVTCTERKSLPVSADLQIRSLPDSSIPERYDTWRARLDRAVDRVPLDRLYAGEAWAQVKRLASTATRRGFGVEVVVASAGLGLCDVRETGPAYAATFSTGHADTVGATPAERTGWWSLIAPDAAERLLRASSLGPVLLVLSAAYAGVLSSELGRLAGAGGDLLLIGGREDIDGLPRLAADRALNAPLGGTVSSLNVRMATAWLEQGDEGALFTEARLDRWTSWAGGVRRELAPSRAALTDDRALAFINDLRVADPRISATRALRQLRDAGFACEQQRFSALFRRSGQVA